MNLGIIILAAGASTRLGKSKQLLEWNGKTLLSNTISQAQSINLKELHRKDIYVILGADADRIAESIQHSSARIVPNEFWSEGIASSIRCGTEALQHHGQYDAMMICLCDQPFITTELLERLIQTFIHSSKNIVSAYYKGSAGAPVVFSSKYFSELLTLSGDKGAKRLIEKYVQDVETLQLENLGIDIDTEDDYHRAKSKTE